MELKMVSTSVVVLSEGNNPRLLNPDFLERNRIVSAEWKAQDVVVTPPFAQVVYENGVHFVVEINIEVFWMLSSSSVTVDEPGTTVFCPLTMNKRAGLFSEIIRSKAAGQYDSGISRQTGLGGDVRRETVLELTAQWKQ